MPIIKGQHSAAILSPSRRQTLLEQMLNEIEGKGKPNGPLIFEIPLDYSDKLDILVVWDEWEDIRSEDRSSLILEAYGNNQGKIAQALGVTYQETVEQNLLPYAVVPMIREGEFDPSKVRNAMLEEGGIALPSEKVDLRFPTMSMAETAHRHLCEKLPRGYWSIVQKVASISSSGV